MGATGAGKSTFIENAMSPGDPTPKAGHGLESETAEIQEYTIGEIMNGFEVILVDTPGFDDTENGDSLAFGQIAGWLKQYPHPLPGVIYIYNIQAGKGTKSFVRSLNILKKICGDSFTPNITLLTNQEEFASEDMIQGAATGGSENEANEANEEVGGELQVFNEGRQVGETSACLAVVKHLAEAGADADDEEKDMKAEAEKLKESDPEMSAYYHEQAEHARSQKENIQKQWSVLANLVDGIGSILAAIAEKCGYPLLRNGVLSLTRAAAMHLGKDDFYPSA
ncbi:hypothetical protein TWF679_004406 [Orbilia oligospora]|uniref:G domain-containing protein n=1 Tax=Orbilia oligospora TaxID=2813651 RepID=A0A8H8VE35_ORBOL|nr:hypothetical protein TWF679_004406 [Orbilia oligospora]